jgi:chromosome segregation ATPase
MKWILFGLFSFALLSCSSLAVVPSSPDTSSETSQPQIIKPSPKNTSLTTDQLRQKINDLRALLQTLKNTAGNLTPLLETFDKQLTALEQSNASLRQDLQTASDASEKLRQDLETLREDFNAYRAQVVKNRLRDGLIIGGISGAVGIIGGIIIGHALK